jgi:hypothetical protein
MRNFEIGQSLFVGDNDFGVLVSVERREGRIVFVEASSCGFEATDPEVIGLQSVQEGDRFTVDGTSFLLSGFDEDEGRPLFTASL